MPIRLILLGLVLIALPLAGTADDGSCAKCKTRLVARANYCHHCGAKVTKPEPATKKPEEKVEKLTGKLTVFSKAELGLKLSVPADRFMIRSSDFKFRQRNTVCEIESSDKRVRGYLISYATGGSALSRADQRLKALQRYVDYTKAETVFHKPLDRPYGPWIVRINKVTTRRRQELAFVTLLARSRSNFVQLTFWFLHKELDARKAELLSILEGVRYEAPLLCPGCSVVVGPDAETCKACKMTLVAPDPELQKLCASLGIQVVVDTSKIYPVRIGRDRLSGANAKPAELKAYGAFLAAELGKLPVGFLRKLELRRIVLPGELYLTARKVPGLAVMTRDEVHLRAAPTATPARRWTLYHELFHVVDFKEEGDIKTDAAWARLNAPGFKYRPAFHSGAGFSDKAPGFVSTYPPTGIAEDKAEIFAAMITQPAKMAARVAKDEVVAAKVTRMKTLLKAFDASLDDAFWKQLTGK